jgi:hypothetical protein
MRTPALHSLFMLTYATLLAACAERAPTTPISSAELDASFSVSAQAVVSLGKIHGQAVNDAGTVVGADGSSLYVWSQASGPQLVGSGVVWDISEDGNAIGGRSAAENPVLWLRGTSSWSELALPHLGFGGAVRSIASDASDAPAIMTGNAWGAGFTRNAAIWTPCAGESDCLNGWHLRTLVGPNANAWGQAVNPSGQVAGMDGSGCCLAIFWNESGSFQLLPPLTSGAASAAWSINDAGTVIVGNSAGRAVAWVRSSATAPFGAPTGLPAKTSGCGSGGGGIAYAVMPDLVTSGTIVGQDCGSPAAWQVTVSGTSLTNMQRVALPSAVKATKGAAHGINRSTSAHHGATGDAGGTGVFWRF